MNFFVTMVRKIRDEGFLIIPRLFCKNLVYAVRNWRDAEFDRRHGVCTSGFLELNKALVSSKNRDFGVRYQPTSARHFECMMSRLDVDLRDYTFVDFGCGKGRVLLMAAHYPFAGIIGVEFSRVLYQQALDNVAHYGLGHPEFPHVQVKWTDAAEFSLPDTPLVLYFFDPFRGQVMAQVLDNIRASFVRLPRPIHLIYYAPVHAQMVEALGIFRRLSDLPLPFDPAVPRQYECAWFETLARSS
ncbi:hypothetical protein CKO35_16445 [Ectothiorhodospira shaposhnikovii]|uniref:class I SAM-dependent methyltransferase n=1 Tax=Ectothiorhodospira shaposhnikovii TaxID=1054 RepID=UPI0019055967|nr:class I SAM-dependent methyltransferase [Ectothiorhodospira shaposhnikovii]MBK1674847.1 hypothetical protein [Ectothiorhodospira shaposhnikovii]